MPRPHDHALHRSRPLAGVGTDDVPDLPAWCAESGCDACRSLSDEEPLAGRRPTGAARARSPTARLPRPDGTRYP